MQRTKYKGFSLIELSVVLTLIALIMSMAVSGLRVQLSSTEITSTQQKLDALKIALENYRTQFGKYPCPAPANLLSSNANYGIASTDCFSTCPAGMQCVANAVNGSLQNMAQGSIPFKSLNISQELSIDSWGNKLTYAVDARFTQDQNRCEMNGNLTMLDYGSNTISNKATYVIVSHGDNSKGAYAPDPGFIPLACDAAAKDGENCNNNMSFRSAEINKSNANTAFYDDVVTFGINANTQYCPAGLTNCQVWFDASDKCSIITNTGGVHRILDKSSSASFAEQTNSGNRPDYSATKLNDRNFITFVSGNTDALYSSIGASLVITPFSFVTVFATSGNASLNMITDGASYSASSYDRGHGLVGSGSVRSYVWPLANIDSPSSVYNNGLPHIAITTVGPTMTHNLFVDGVLRGTTAGTQSNFNWANTLILGSHQGFGQGNHNLMEYIYFNKELTDGERKALELYLARKWGINY